VLVDKPLAPTADAARGLFEKAAAAGVKTAYAATSRYQPAVLLAREMVARGDIGSVHEVECVSHHHWPRLTSFGWPHLLETGGGRLNNNFTHKLSIVLNVLGGTVLTVAGESRNDLKRVPVGPPSHDFRNFATAALTREEADRCAWRDVDSDWSYTVLARVGQPGSDPDAGVSATFRHSALVSSLVENYVAFYGETGTIHIAGAYAQGALHLVRAKNDWEQVPIPPAIEQALPSIKDDAQRNWTQLAREFVGDIRGQGDAGYLKFRDGWIHQQVIDAVRSASGWSQISS
jgi:predicted dehydrogenase